MGKRIALSYTCPQGLKRAIIAISGLMIIILHWSQSKLLQTTSWACMAPRYWPSQGMRTPWISSWKKNGMIRQSLFIPQDQVSLSFLNRNVRSGKWGVSRSKMARALTKYMYDTGLTTNTWILPRLTTHSDWSRIDPLVQPFRERHHSFGHTL